MKILLILLLFLSTLVNAEVYQWQDTNGEKHFSDRPTAPDAEKITSKPPPAFRVSKPFTMVIPLYWQMGEKSVYSALIPPKYNTVIKRPMQAAMKRKNG